LTDRNQSRKIGRRSQRLLNQVILSSELRRADDCLSLYCAAIPNADVKSLPEILVLAQKAEKSLTTRDNALGIVETRYISIRREAWTITSLTAQCPIRSVAFAFDSIVVKGQRNISH
jgi:hypothetical protein